MRKLENCEMASLSAGDMGRGFCNGLSVGMAGAGAVAWAVGAAVSGWGIAFGIVATLGCAAYSYYG